MTLRQLTIFVVFAGLAIGALVALAGDWSVDRPERATSGDAAAEPVEHIHTSSGMALPDSPLVPRSAENVFVEAPPEHLYWEDPQNPGHSIEIPYFVAWKLYADSVAPLPGTEDDGPMGARCENVLFRTYREPATHVEAMALRRGEDDVVLHREFRADEALIFGRLAAKLSVNNDRQREQVELGRDSELQLRENLRIDDVAEGLVITGDEVRIHPKLGTATGDGLFEIRHPAFLIRGHGLDLHRLNETRTRVEIHKNPILELLEEVDTPNARNPADFGDNDFRRSSVRSKGRAVVIRDLTGTDEHLRIEMADDVHVEQEGGRTLDADRLVVSALNREDPDAPTDARSNGWRLRRLVASGTVKIRHTVERDAGDAHVVKISTERLTHDVPEAGIPTTLLEGASSLSFEGDIPMGADAAPGVIYASCTKRAWIGPVRGGSRPEGTSHMDLRRLLLEGGACVEHVSKDVVLVQDKLEGDEIELIFQVAPSQGDATRDPADLTGGGPEASISAIEFTARGNVRLDGTRLQGNTDLLVARNLQTERPHLSAIGPGTRFAFPDIGANQRMLGGDTTEKRRASGSGSAPSEASAAEPQWVLKRLDASGSVDVSTSLGGPSVGMPTSMTGNQLTYDDMSGIAQMKGGPALITAGAINGEDHTIGADVLSVERARGLLRARGNVRASLWTPLQKMNAGGVSGAFSAQSPEPATMLEITTEDRIDIAIVRVSDGSLRQDVEQTLRIFGPLTAELRSERMAIDRLRAMSLTIALALSVDGEKAGLGPSMPGTARARPTSRQPSTEPERRVPKAALTLVTLEAGELALDISTGTARSVDAFGGVVIATDMGRIIGDRIQMRADTQTAHVVGSASQRAEAWFYENEALRNQITSRQFTFHWDTTGAREIRAVGRSNDPVLARLYQPGDLKNPQVERFEISSEGPIVITRERMDATVVWVSRSTRKGRSGAWSEPARLFAPVLEVEGMNLLSPTKSTKASQSFRRHVKRVTARGPETYFRYMNAGQLTQIWGRQFVLDVENNEGLITGSDDQDVRYKQGDRLHSDWKRVTIDLVTGLPRMEGPRIVLRTGPGSGR